jgi:ATP-binding cassette subfamily A (ABC1) protein 3
LRIAKIYSNGFLAVKGTSFGVDQGTVFGLLGPNGAGKSTTFNMITAKLKPTSGNILLQN